MKQINIRHITNLHNDALGGLNFYEQELDILQKRLEEIAADNTSREVSENVEHFQNQFIIHREKIDEMRHAIHENQRVLENQLLANNGFASESSIDANEGLYDQYIEEEKLFNELRHRFNRFAAEWL